MADLEKELSDKEELDSSTAQLQVLRLAVQQHLKAGEGQEKKAIRRAPMKLQDSRQRGQAQRKASPAGGDFAAMLQAALQKAQSSSKGRTRRGVQGAEQQAKETAQRREKDPAAKRVRLVKDMGYLSLKRAALLGLLQQQQEEHLAAEVRKLNLAEVTAQLLDARWSTQQLEVAARAAQAAAQEIKEQRQQAKSAKLAPQQPRPQQQLQQQDQQPQPQAPLPSKAPRLARQCMLVQPMTMYKEDSNSDSSSSSGKSSNDSCSDCDDSN